MSGRIALLTSTVTLTAIMTSAWAFQSRDETTPPVEAVVNTPATETFGAPPERSLNAGSEEIYPIHIRTPQGPPRVGTGQTDMHGNQVTTSCQTCHATRPPETKNRTPADLTEFHRELTVSHGTISCLSCHNDADYDSLKLADGRRVEFTDVMTLCAQCHGPQMNDYQHGVHGGMTGYWDRRRGPQSKLNCIDCHNPHSPQFPSMRPTFKPKDRFLSPQGAEH